METLCEGKHLSLVSRNGWEFVQRNNVTGIVEIVAMTDRKMLYAIMRRRA